jgi:hypothetical protein
MSGQVESRYRVVEELAGRVELVKDVLNEELLPGVAAAAPLVAADAAGGGSDGASTGSDGAEGAEGAMGQTEALRRRGERSRAWGGVGVRGLAREVDLGGRARWRGIGGRGQGACAAVVSRRLCVHGSPEVKVKGRAAGRVVESRRALRLHHP